MRKAELAGLVLALLAVPKKTPRSRSRTWGTHTVLVEYWVEVEDNGDCTDVEILVVTDKTLGQVREYRFDPTATSFGIAEADGEVEIVKNPDGSYTVDGELVANGKPADVAPVIYPCAPA